MEILVGQTTKLIEEKHKTFFLDEAGNEYIVDWVEARFENKGFKLKEDSQFNSKKFIYKGKCKISAVNDSSELSPRHIFVEKKTKNRYYLDSAEFEANFNKVGNSEEE